MMPLLSPFEAGSFEFAIWASQVFREPWRGVEEERVSAVCASDLPFET